MFLQVLFSVSKPQAIYMLIVFVTLTVLWMLWQRQAAQPGGQGIKPRKLALYASLLVFVGFCVCSEPLFRAVVYWLYGVSERVIGDNASAEQVAADHVIGGWVQVGTLLSKLFAAISFYITSYTLPWLLQRTTHPVLTDWAKENYKHDFENLASLERFEVYGRLQTNQSIRFAASLLAAALLV